MFNKYLYTVALLLSAHIAIAQQFIGLSPENAVQQIPYNPAWVNTSITGPEVNLFGVSVLAGNNAYSTTKTLLFHPNDTGAAQGRDYFLLPNKSDKRGWVNADIQGPSFSFSYKHKHQFGIYSRFRTIVSAGNITDSQFRILSNPDGPLYYNHTIDFTKAGGMVQAFGELGFTYGQMIRDDEVYKIRAGVTLKYLMGWAAMNLYTKSLTYQRINKDTLIYATGSLTGMYTYNMNPSSTGDLSQRAGKGSFGLDIGMQMEYHPDGDPNSKSPYLYSIAASVTDIGSVAYVGDKGSGTYDVHAKPSQFDNYTLVDADSREYGQFLSRMVADSAATLTKKFDKFHISLPTALRLNGDWYFGDGLYTSVNILLNMKGKNGTVYTAGYVSYFNFTPRYDVHYFKFSIPFTLMRWRTLTMGSILNFGPFYVGSSTILSSMLLSSSITNVDFFTGFNFKIVKNDRVRLHTYDNGYDGSGLNLKRFIPRFLRKKYKYSLCPSY